MNSEMDKADPVKSARTVVVYEMDGEKAGHFSADGELTVPPGTWLRISLASGGHWYGHGFSHRQPYPLEQEPLINDDFAVNNIQSPIWMCSAGYAFLADTSHALQVRLNQDANGWLALRCRDRAFSLRVFQGGDLPEAHRKLMRALNWPSPAPEKRLFGDSIFCTWTQYPRAITQERILQMARLIREHAYPCSLITIDDRWESVFGELRFSADFPDPKSMMDELHRLGFRVLLWVTPFINREAATFNHLAEQGWLAPRNDQSGPSLLQWWGGTAGIIDLTHPGARAWFRSQLGWLKEELGVDGFKIDGGDAKYQPDPAVTAWHEPVGPSGYVDRLLEVFEEVAPGLCESRTAWLSPGRKILWREGGKDSHWGIDNGLRAMVTLGLHLSLLGYDLLIPDMIPGRIQTLISSLPLPTDELFVRWCEVSALMPIMQFSYFPWNFAEPTALAARQYSELHKALEDYLHEQSVERRAPLLRPIWFDFPHCRELYSVNDQFMLGSDLLVAPVLNEKEVARDVVLPPGRWRDAWTGEVYEQDLLLQHPAPCPGLPLFVRAERIDLFNLVACRLSQIARGSIASGQISATYSCGLDRDLKVTG